ncbi:MAG: Uridine kinase [Blastococcus sp.]|nr:Uridine kinase [Blastococcus sp.]
MTGLAGLARRIRAAPPRLGGTRLVCVDGPAGSGKTTFAGKLAEALGPGVVVVHMDDLYEGWTLSGSVERLTADVLEPLAERRPGAYRPYDWAAGRFGPDVVDVPPAPVLIVEGCGSGRRVLDRWMSLLIWVEAPAAVRLARGLSRDGIEVEGHWRQWQQDELAVFAADDTRARAGLRVDGTAPADGTDLFRLP